MNNPAVGGAPVAGAQGAAPQGGGGQRDTKLKFRDYNKAIEDLKKAIQDQEPPPGLMRRKKKQSP